MWTGLLAFRARVVASHFRQMLTLGSFVVDAAAYLYREARRSGQVEEWEEMEKWMATMYAEDGVFWKGPRVEDGNNTKTAMDIFSNFAAVAPVFDPKRAKQPPTQQQVTEARYRRDYVRPAHRHPREPVQPLH